MCCTTRGSEESSSRVDSKWCKKGTDLLKSVSSKKGRRVSCLIRLEELVEGFQIVGFHVPDRATEEECQYHLEAQGGKRGRSHSHGMRQNVSKDEGDGDSVGSELLTDGELDPRRGIKPIVSEYRRCREGVREFLGLDDSRASFERSFDGLRKETDEGSRRRRRKRNEEYLTKQEEHCQKSHSSLLMKRRRASARISGYPNNEREMKKRERTDSTLYHTRYKSVLSKTILRSFRLTREGVEGISTRTISRFLSQSSP